MKIAIVEDEPLTKKRIQSIISQHNPTAQIMYTGQSLEDLTHILHHQNNFDVLFCDLHLADGLSFDVLKLFKITTPIVFITAYDQYALQSFDHNCIDYILKPIQEDRLIAAIEKAKKFLWDDQKSALSAEVLQQIFHGYHDKVYKQRFLAKYSNKIKLVSVQDIAYFFTENSVTYLVCSGDSKKYIVDYSLQELEDQLLNPTEFYRINRSSIVSMDYLQEMKPYQNGRLLLSLNSPSFTDLIVSREKVSQFKEWINK
ncbi:LytR/AlgR family response regulator transcription factor [Mongoliitalea daihaiensis]|uniref:LytR/AlgR family response regulator transcription factor n=1 Tax=Mongoliitalea daihaiensis TaxID=2782006 RepID=UPI001F283F28|nr:LytTR family DNA-binding domain-containing protein [Mongoliitalea daihaiensis]UJP64602.1 response regulator transcription factor [Mongoliitalea daihaiensis]